MITKFKAVIAAAIVAIIALVTGAAVAFANPSYIAAGAQTSTATTSPAYLIPGVASSTITYDSYAQPAAGGNAFVANGAVLAMQQIGSSTSAVLGIKFEFSNDGIDWYSNFLVGPAGLSTTTSVYALGVPNSLTWTYSAAVNKALISVPTPTRYVRAVLTVSGANASVWAQIVPTKELK